MIGNYKFDPKEVTQEAKDFVKNYFETPMIDKWLRWVHENMPQELQDEMNASIEHTQNWMVRRALKTVKNASLDADVNEYIAQLMELYK